MRGIDAYAVAAALVTLAVTGWMLRARKRRGPSRGFGAAYAALFIAAVWGVAVLHGAVVGFVAIVLGPTPVAWACAAMHVALIIAFFKVR